MSTDPGPGQLTPAQLAATAEEHRKLAGNALMRADDITAGYRAYRADAIAALDLDSIESKGYCFQIDMTGRTVDAGFRVLEVPIVFVERELGESKMSSSIISEAFTKVAGWGLARRGRQVRALFGR